MRQFSLRKPLKYYFTNLTEVIIFVIISIHNANLMLNKYIQHVTDITQFLDGREYCYENYIHSVTKPFGMVSKKDTYCIIITIYPSLKFLGIYISFLDHKFDLESYTSQYILKQSQK